MLQHFQITDERERERDEPEANSEQNDRKRERYVHATHETMERKLDKREKKGPELGLAISESCSSKN